MLLLSYADEGVEGGEDTSKGRSMACLSLPGCVTPFPSHKSSKTSGSQCSQSSRWLSINEVPLQKATGGRWPLHLTRTPISLYLGRLEMQDERDNSLVNLPKQFLAPGGVGACSRGQVQALATPCYPAGLDCHPFRERSGPVVSSCIRYQ